MMNRGARASRRPENITPMVKKEPSGIVRYTRHGGYYNDNLKFRNVLAVTITIPLDRFLNAARLNIIHCFVNDIRRQQSHHAFLRQIDYIYINLFWIHQSYIIYTFSASALYQYIVFLLSSVE